MHLYNYASPVREFLCAFGHGRVKQIRWERKNERTKGIKKKTPIVRLQQGMYLGVLICDEIESYDLYLTHLPVSFF